MISILDFGFMMVTELRRTERENKVAFEAVEV